MGNAPKNAQEIVEKRSTPYVLVLLVNAGVV